MLRTHLLGITEKCIFAICLRAHLLPAHQWKHNSDKVKPSIYQRPAERPEPGMQRCLLPRALPLLFHVLTLNYTLHQHAVEQRSTEKAIVYTTVISRPWEVMPGWKKLRSDKTSRTSAGNKMFNSCRYLHYRSLFSTFDSQAELWKKPGSGKMGLKRKLCDNLPSNNKKVIKKICPKLGNFALVF